MKDKLLNSLGSFGVILWYLLSILIAVIPIVMIGKSFLVNLVLFLIIQFIPATSGFFWIWGLVCALRGPQDIIAIIYYVLFVVMFLPYFVSFVLSFFQKRS